jgi:hypothetical protein
VPRSSQSGLSVRAKTSRLTARRLRPDTTVRSYSPVAAQPGTRRPNRGEKVPLRLLARSVLKRRAVMRWSWVVWAWSKPRPAPEASLVTRCGRKVNLRRSLADGVQNAGRRASRRPRLRDRCDSQWSPFHRSSSNHLVPESDGVTYRLPPRSIAPLVTYMYGALQLPGVCLVNLERSVSDRDIVSRFRFYDDTGDGIADRIELRGRVVTLGQPSGDFETECGDDGRLFRASGHVLSEPVGLHAEGDALDPSVRVTGGFLTEGTAVFATAAKELPAEPRTLDGFVYGFVAASRPPPTASSSRRSARSSQSRALVARDRRCSSTPST